MGIKVSRVIGAAVVALMVPVGLFLPSTNAPITLVPAALETNAPQTVVTLGDSVPAGTACRCTPYGDLVARSLAGSGDAAVTSINDAIPGQGSSGLLRQLNRGRATRHVSSADLVIVQIGANDYDIDHDPADMDSLTANVTAILERIDALTDARVVVVDYWNVQSDGSVARAEGADYVEAADAMTEAVNAVLRGAAREAGAVFVDVRHSFDADPDDFLAGDGDHPNERGHEVLAAAVEEALEVRAYGPVSA